MSPRGRVVSALTLALIAASMGSSVLRVQRQIELDRQLIAAVTGLDARLVHSLLERGANPNTRSGTVARTSGWQRILQILHLRSVTFTGPSVLEIVFLTE